MTSFPSVCYCSVNACAFTYEIIQTYAFCMHNSYNVGFYIALNIGYSFIISVSHTKCDVIKWLFPLIVHRGEVVLIDAFGLPS